MSADEAADYHLMIHAPMDLSTMARKLEEGSYLTAADFHRDVVLIAKNCHEYNEPKSLLVKYADALAGRAGRLLRQLEVSEKRSFDAALAASPELEAILAACPRA